MSAFTIVDPKGLKIVKVLKEHIRKGWGKKCKEFKWGCSVCDVYLAVDILETTFK